MALRTWISEIDGVGKNLTGAKWTKEELGLMLLVVEEHENIGHRNKINTKIKEMFPNRSWSSILNKHRIVKHKASGCGTQKNKRSAINSPQKQPTVAGRNHLNEDCLGEFDVVKIINNYVRYHISRVKEAAMVRAECGVCKLKDERIEHLERKLAEFGKVRAALESFNKQR